MKQDRNMEYLDTMKDVCDYPNELDTMKNRLNGRIKRRIVKRVITSLSAFAGVATLFTAAVNTSTAFAQTINRIPVISELANFVKFDKGLQNFVNNQYVQEVNLEQEVNGLTLKMPYVIADSKRLMLFFQLPDELVDEYEVVVDLDQFKPDILSNSYKSFSEAETGDKKLHMIGIRTEEMIPQDITIPVSIVKLFSTTFTGIDDPIDTSSYEATVMADYEFKLHLNGYQEPIINVLNQEVQVLDQTVIIKSITQYPTGVEISK